MALQFSKFENGFPETKRTRREGLIPKFVRDHLHVPNQDFAKQCVQAGQKQLKTEKAFRNALGQADRSFVGTGVSALTALTITPFKNLRLGEIPAFIEQFFSDSANIELPLRQPAIDSRGSGKKSFHVLEVLERVSKWLNEFQTCYDGALTLLLNGPLTDVFSKESIRTGRLFSGLPMASDNNTTLDPCLREDMEDILHTNSDRINENRRVSPFPSRQQLIANEDTLSSGSSTEECSITGSSPERSAPSTQHTDCSSVSGNGGLETHFAQSPLTRFESENAFTGTSLKAPTLSCRSGEGSIELEIFILASF